MSQEKLERGLSNRHVQLISIGGAIGTGLFLASGKSIAIAGPSVLLAYMIVGMFVFFIMRSLGELLLANLDCHSFVELAHQYLGRRWAFVTGWTYWFCWITVAMSDLTAVGMYMRYWFPHLPQWIPALLMLLFLMALNLLSVKLFGEIEFWLALIKILAIVALIGVGLYMIFTHHKLENGIVASFANLYQDGGFFPHGFSGFILSFQLAVFSFTGVELVGLTAGETQDPEKTLPKAINNIPVRILLFYVGSLAVIMAVQPWNIIDPTQSPFVTVFSSIGIAAAASIINFVVLSSAASACNSALFSTSRMLYGLAKDDNAPKTFAKLNKNSTPAMALLMSSVVVGITIVLNYVMPEGVFSLISGISTVCFLFIWTIIVICHMKFLKQTKDEDRPKFRLKGAKVINILSLIFLALIIVICAVLESTRIALFITPIWFIALLIIYQVKFKEQ
ncbi:amino acid permease [Catellicoccus marimammalium]|uniref:D-serine/D-alanine/glycine transporter n=1 Tax=Catellicoccus marimammalium M35/04/3 TaxID=1234409 RepID=K8ZPC1_9ENTE|nr:amino acid permease [Catellicoccus marimammalium]EKU27426.1 D-serine/D-alanine/glycine transporter [Catellicoccus marimammalium M35/04/3]